MLAGAELVCWCRPAMSAQRPWVTAPLPRQGPVASRDTPILSSRAGPGRISASLRYGTPGSTGRLAATPRLGPGLRSDAEIHATAGAGTACARSQNKTDYFGSIREDAVSEVQSRSMSSPARRKWKWILNLGPVRWSRCIEWPWLVVTPTAGSNIFTQPVPLRHLPRPVPPAGLRQVVLLGYYGFRHVSLVRRLHVIGTPGRAAFGRYPGLGRSPGYCPGRCLQTQLRSQ